MVVVIFGSNSGNKHDNIEEAIALLSAKTGDITIASSYYETAPWGFESTEQFLNKVVAFETTLSPEDFLNYCLETEQKLGRIRLPDVRYASRTIDIDILFYDSRIINTPNLTIPHPRLPERNFVLTPLNEIMPAFIHPLLGKRISELAKECEDKGDVRTLPDSPDLSSDSI